MSEVKAGIGGEHYQPYAERTGGESVVFFTRDLSAEGLKKAYAAIQGNLTGKVAVKLHTGEQNGPNIIPRPWVKSLMEQIPNSTIVETNTYYEGDRHTTAQHRETLKINGWTFCPVERIKTRHGLRQLSYMQELGMGNRKYKLIDLDNNQSPLTLQEAVAHVVPFVEPKKVTL